MVGRPPPFLMPALYRTLKANQAQIQGSKELMHLKQGFRDKVTGAWIPAALLATWAVQYAVGHYNMSHDLHKKPGF